MLKATITIDAPERSKDEPWPGFQLHLEAIALPAIASKTDKLLLTSLAFVVDAWMAEIGKSFSKHTGCKAAIVSIEKPGGKFLKNLYKTAGLPQ